MNKKSPNESSKIAGRVYEPSDDQKNDPLSAGLAETHELFSDSYKAGEIGGTIGSHNIKNRQSKRQK